MFPSTTTFVVETPLPPSATSSSILRILHDHDTLVRLGPLFVSCRVVSPPSPSNDDVAATAAPSTTTGTSAGVTATYEVTESIPLLPGGLWRTRTVFAAEFTDLPDGLRTVVRASLGVAATARWLVDGGGEDNGEGGGPVRLREEVEVRCSGFLIPFVKRTMKVSHEALHGRLMELCEKQQQQPEQ